MMNEIKVGIIGLGAVGERLLRKFVEHPRTKIVALCDTNEERLQVLKEELGNVQTFISHHDLLQTKELDLVYLAVPPKYHHGVALDIIGSGKHILCEKPLANSLLEAEEMYYAVEKANVVHAMNFPMPYSNVFKHFKEKIHSEQLGKIKRIDVKMHFPVWPRQWQQNAWIDSREQGGFIREISPHYIQMIHDIFGELTNIQTTVDYPSNADLCENSFITRLELADGTPVLFDGLSGVGEQEQIVFKVYGENGTISILDWAKLEESTIESGNKLLPIERDNHLSELISEVLNAIDGKSAHIVSFKEGLEVQRVLEQLLGKE